MTLRARFAATFAPPAAALVLLLAGCSDGGSASDGAPAPTAEEATTTTSTAPETTTTTEPPEADAGTKALAAGAVYRVEDLGEGWSEAVAAPDYATEGLDVDDCFVPEGSELAQLPLGAVVGAPNFRSPTGQVFVASWAAAFADGDTAAAWAEQTQDPSYDECQRGLLEETSSNGGGAFEVRTSTTDAQRASLGTDDLVRVASFDLVNDGEVTSSVNTYTYRIDRVLLHVVVELGPTDAATLEAALADETAARTAASARVLGE
jgi:hypothetical protein